MFLNVLVAVDGSAHADAALTRAIELAVCGHARLTLLTAVAPVPSVAYLGAGGQAAATIAVDAEREAQAILRRARERVPEDVSVTTILSTKPVRTALMQQIEEGRHDLVVMGSRGLGGVRSAVLGSVSHHVLHHSQVAVLIVHADPARRTDSPEARLVGVQ